MRLRDWTFQRVFAKVFVYNILFEDSEVDERFLGVDDKSTLFEIAGAGCRVTGHLARNPRRIDAVDINRHHLALTALKVQAARKIESYNTFYDLFGRGWNPQPRRLVQGLTQDLPDWMRKHWKDRHPMFERSIHKEGLTASMLNLVRRITGMDESWLRSRIPETFEERCRAVDETIGPLIGMAPVKLLLDSPLNLLALGINFTQKDRLLHTEQTDIGSFMVHHLKRLASTDLERNWFAWWAVAGQFNHELPDSVPPYLRRDHHEKARLADTRVAYHPRNVFDVLDDAAPNTWSHYTLCDAVDWMPAPVQRRLFDSVLRTSRDGGVLLYRSVETDSTIRKLGLEKHFIPMEEATRVATEADRSRQYRSVNFYRIAH